MMKVLKFITVLEKTKATTTTKKTPMCSPKISGRMFAWNKSVASFPHLCHLEKVSHFQNVTALWLRWSVLPDPSLRGIQDLLRDLLVLLEVRFPWVLMGSDLCSPISWFLEDEVWGWCTRAAHGLGNPWMVASNQEAHALVFEPCLAVRPGPKHYHTLSWSIAT